MNKKIHAVIPYILAIFTAFIAGTHAALALEYVPLTTIPGLLKAGQATNPVTIVKGIYGVAIGAGSVLAVVMIIMAGFKYMYEESITGKSGAREQIENAFLGLLVILGSYILLRTVNADLVNFNPELPGGVGGVSGLVASDQQYEAAQAHIRAAQASVKTLNADIAKLDTQIAALNAQLAESADDPDGADPAQAAATETLAKLQAERDIKSAQATYITGTALGTHSSETIEAYLSDPESQSAANVDAYINSGTSGLNSAKAKLEEIYSRTKDPLVKAQIDELNVKKRVFDSDAAQLKAISDYKVGADMTFTEYGTVRTETPASVATSIKKTGAETVAYLQQQNKTAEAAEVQAATDRRVKLICPSCKQ